MTMVAESEPVPYQAWGVSLALHGVLIGSALFISTQVVPVIKQEVFHWDVALVQSALDASPPEVPQPTPAARSSKATPVQMPKPLPVVEPPSDTAVLRAAASASPEVVRPTMVPPKPEAVQEILTAKIEPVASAGPNKEERQQDELQPKNVIKPEPRREIMPAEVSAAALHAQPESGARSVQSIPAVQAAPSPSELALTAPVAESVASFQSAPQVAHQPVIHHEEVSPEDLAPAWRSLVPVGEPALRGADHATGSVAAASSSQAAAVPASPPVQAKAPPAPSATKVDNAWLAESLGRRIRELTRYPSSARLNGWEGKVVLRVVIRSDGHLADVTVHRSSGHEVLDRAAMETIRLACPIHMKQTLSAAEVAVYVPIVYSLAG